MYLDHLSLKPTERKTAVTQPNFRDRHTCRGRNHMAKTGPKRKTGVGRYPGGQIRHSDRGDETPEQVTATALDARMRQILGVDTWLKHKDAGKALKAARNDMANPLLGSALGRLLLAGRDDLANGISQRQYDAGVYFGWLYRNNARVRGWPSPNARGAPVEMTSAGVYNSADLDPELAQTDEEKKTLNKRIADLKSSWSDMYGALMEADGRRGAVFEAIKRALLEDLDGDVGELKLGLNAIDRIRRA